MDNINKLETCKTTNHLNHNNTYLNSDLGNPLKTINENNTKNSHLNLSSEDVSNILETKKIQAQTELETIESPIRKYADIVKEVKSSPILFNLIKEAILELSFETVNYNIKEEQISPEFQTKKAVNTKKLLLDYLNSYFTDYLLEEYIIIEKNNEEEINLHSTFEDKHIIELSQFNDIGNEESSILIKDDLGTSLYFTKKEMKNIIDNANNRYWKVENISGADIYVRKIELEKEKNCFRRQAYQDYLGMTHYVNLYNFIAKNMIQSHPKDYSKKDVRVKSFKANVKFLQEDFNQLLQVLILHDQENKIHLIDLSNASAITKKSKWDNGIYIDLHGNHFHLNSEKITQTYCVNELNQAIQLLDENNEHFYVKKCYLKQLINQIMHNQSLPDNDQIIDIYGKIRNYCPSSLYDILIQVTNIAECFISKENKYVLIRDRDPKKKPSMIKREYLVNLFKDKDDINGSEKTMPLTERISCNVTIQTQSGEMRKVYKSELGLDYCYIKIYDLKGMEYVVTYKCIKRLFDKLIAKETLEEYELLDSYSGDKIALKPQCIRSKVNNYFSLQTNKSYHPYRIINEEKRSYCKITNCLNGQDIMIKTNDLLKILKSNSLRDHIYFNEAKSIKLCIEEIKQTLKELNKENEYLLVNNINNYPCHLQKNILMKSIDMLINNRSIPDVINVIDIDNHSQFINITKVLSDFIELSPFPYVNDEIMSQKSNTYCMSPQGVIALINDVEYAKRNQINELFEFIRVIDINKEDFYIRKPFIRNLLSLGNSIPKVIEIYDYTYKLKRIVQKKDLFPKEINSSSGSNFSSTLPSPIPLSNVLFDFKVNTYIEVIDCEGNKHLILKLNLISLIKNKTNAISLEDVNGKRFKLNDNYKLSQMNTNHEWLWIKNINKKGIFVHKSIIKSIIKNHYHNITLFRHMEIYDYERRREVINPQEIIDCFMINKGYVSQKIILEIKNK